MRPASFYTRYFFLLGLTFVFPAYSQSRYTLESALKTARVNNPVLKTEQFYTGMAQADATTAGLRPNIKLNNQTLQSANSRYFPENTSWNNSRNRQVWWQLTKTFQLPNQRQYKIDFARKQFGVAEKNYAETERNLYLQVANKWLDVWGTQMQLNLIRSAKNNVDSLAAINKLRLKNQVITQTDLMRTQLLASQYELQLKTVLQDYRNQLTELSFLVGAADTVDIGSSDEFFSKADWINNMDSVFAQAARNRSDVQIA
ncbi:MAG: TolC family protein, partial [Azospira oryzae]